MAELLRKQYESTFSEPDLDMNLDNLFGHEGREEDKEKEDDTEKEADKEKEGDREKEDERQEDEEENERQEDEEEDEMFGRGQEDESRPTTVAPGHPTFTNVAFDYMDIVAAIEQLSL